MRLQQELLPLRKYCDFIDQNKRLLARLQVYAYPSIYIYFLAKDDILNAPDIHEMNNPCSIVTKNLL